MNRATPAWTKHYDAARCISYYLVAGWRIDRLVADDRVWGWVITAPGAAEAQPISYPTLRRAAKVAARNAAAKAKARR